MTSNLANSAFSVLVGPQDLADGKLAAPSRVKVDKIVTLHRSVVRRRVGRLADAAMRQVWAELHALLGVR